MKKIITLNFSGDIHEKPNKTHRLTACCAVIQIKKKIKVQIKRHTTASIVETDCTP